MNIPIVVVQVFCQKLTVLESTLKTMFLNAGHLLYMVHSIEFQKWGVPHMHILLKFECDYIHLDDIDAIVSAEMPSDPSNVELIQNLMMHNHHSHSRPPSKYFQKVDDNGHQICHFGYPHPLQSVTSIYNEGWPHYQRQNNSDEMIVPHCLPLLQTFQCHLNFEVMNTSHLFQYLFKYIHKGKTHMLTFSINTNSLCRPQSCVLLCSFQQF